MLPSCLSASAQAELADNEMIQIQVNSNSTKSMIRWNTMYLIKFGKNWSTNKIAKIEIIDQIYRVSHLVADLG